MNKTAQLIKGHLSGSITAKSEKLLSKVSSALKSKGYKAPFAIKKISQGDVGDDREYYDSGEDVLTDGEKREEKSIKDFQDYQKRQSEEEEERSRLLGHYSELFPRFVDFFTASVSHLAKKVSEMGLRAKDLNSISSEIARQIIKRTDELISGNPRIPSHYIEMLVKAFNSTDIEDLALRLSENEFGESAERESVSLIENAIRSVVNNKIEQLEFGKGWPEFGSLIRERSSKRGPKMNKTAKLIRGYLNGEKTEASKELMSKVSSSLKSRGYKAPFAIKKISGHIYFTRSDSKREANS